jgi:hypothetical protein
MTSEEARQFIVQQRARFELDGITGATRKQRARMAALDVISPEERASACTMAANLPRELGPPPHGDSGRMRVVNFHTGEVWTQRAPASRLDLELDEAIDELQTAAL